jgi:hypothetical protein
MKRLPHSVLTYSLGTLALTACGSLGAGDLYAIKVNGQCTVSLDPDREQTGVIHFKGMNKTINLGKLERTAPKKDELESDPLPSDFRSFLVDFDPPAGKKEYRFQLIFTEILPPNAPRPAVRYRVDIDKTTKKSFKAESAGWSYALKSSSGGIYGKPTVADPQEKYNGRPDKANYLLDIAYPLLKGVNANGTPGT